MLMPKNIPLAATSMEDINQLFLDFQHAYEKIFLHYIPLKSWTTQQRSLGYKAVMPLIRTVTDESLFEYPKFMREFLGSGVLPSFNQLGQLAEITLTKSPPASKVGLALSGVHYAMRNPGKKWGEFFDKKHSVISPQLREMIAYFEAVDAVEKIVTRKDGEKIVLVTPAEMRAAIEALPVPKSLENKVPHEKADALREEFRKLPFTPVIRGGKSYELTNQILEWDLRQVPGIDDDVYLRHTPTSAIAWGIGYAGANVLGRPQIKSKEEKWESPMRIFLGTCIGVEKDAGDKMAYLHRVNPEVYDNYDLETIYQVVSEQRYWIRAARATNIIRGEKDEGFSPVLKKIGKEPNHITFGSASKIAVLMFAMTERILEKKPDTDPRLIFTIRKLAEEMYEVSAPTEKDIQEAKRRARRDPLDTMPGSATDSESDRRTAFYTQLKDEILKQQRTKVAPVLSKPENADALYALQKLIEENSNAIFLPEARQFVEHAMKYCLDRINKTLTEAARAGNIQQARSTAASSETANEK